MLDLHKCRSYPRVPLYVPTLGSHPRVSPKCPTLQCHLRVPPQSSILGSYLRVLPQGPTQGPGSQIPTQGPGSHFSRTSSYRLEACSSNEKEALAQIFSCEFREIFKNTFLQKTSGQVLLEYCKQYGLLFILR